MTITNFKFITKMLVMKKKIFIMKVTIIFIMNAIMIIRNFKIKAVIENFFDAQAESKKMK